MRLINHCLLLDTLVASSPPVFVLDFSLTPLSLSLSILWCGYSYSIKVSTKLDYASACLSLWVFDS